MLKVEPPDPFKNLLREMEAIYCVLEFDFFVNDKNRTVKESHYAVAKAFLQKCEEANREVGKNFDWTDFPPHANVKPFEWDESRLTGKRISFEEFIGTRAPGPKELAANSWNVSNVDGLLTAFFHPPYGILGSMQSNMLLFDKLVDALSGPDANSDLEIYSWDTACSNCFDDGHEWWGAFFWTISRKSDMLLIVVVASATD